MLQMEKRRRYLLIGGCLLAGLLLSVLVLSERSGAAPEVSTPVPAPESSDGGRFSVLGSATIGRVPAENRTSVNSLTEVAQPGNAGPVEVSAIGTVTAAEGKEVTVALIGESLCAIQALDSACGLVDDVAKGRLIGARPRSCGHYWVFGLAPDGVKTIEVDQAKDGDIDSTIPVVGNVFEGVLKAAPTTVTGVDGAGQTAFETNVALDYFAATNEACG